MSQGKTAYRTVGAVVIGNALDWYDFTLYGYFALTIGKLFFPSDSPWTSLLSALAVFGTAYVVRPLGGIVLAQMADQWGRKRVLVFVIALMTIGTAMIAFAPTYATIGIAAPAMIALSRLLQGFAAGGEFASATAFLVEHAPPHRRGLYGAWQFSGQGVAILLSGIAGSLMAQCLAPEQFEEWGWRVPFIFGLIIGPIGIYMRLALTDLPITSAEKSAPLREAFASYKTRMLIGFGLVIGGSASLYVLFVFMPTYAIRVLGLDLKAALVAPVAAGLTVAIFCPVMGLISDAIGRKHALVASALGLLLALYPCFLWLREAPSVQRLALVECAFGLLFSIGGGPFNAALAEMFPARLRATGMSVAYNFGVAIFGGLALFTVTWLIQRTGNALAPGYYVAACVTASLVAALALPADRPARSIAGSR